MKLLDILNSPWAIIPTKLEEIRNIYLTHLRGDKIDIKKIEMDYGQSMQNNPQGYEIKNEVAIIPIEGVIAKKANLFHKVSGGASTELIARDLRNAIADKGVSQIVLYIDSPGGSVDGTQELAGLVSELKKIKQIFAYTDGCIASAAYWIASAADKIYISGDTNDIGSIGVVATHTDISKREEMIGVKTTEITAGKFKRIVSNYEPLSKDGREVIQEQIDLLYTAFVSDVAKYRNASINDVLEKMADGRVFIGRQAIDQGLVDGVSQSLDDFITYLTDGVPKPKINQLRSAKMIKENKSAVVPIPEDRVKICPTCKMECDKTCTDCPNCGYKYDTPEDPKALSDASKEALILSAKKAECERIKGVEEALIPGHEALINTLKFDGKTTAGEAALAVNKAERELAKTSLSKIKTDSAPVVPFDNLQQDEQNISNLPFEDQCKKVWDGNSEIRKEFGTFAVYEAFRKAESKNQTKIYGKK